MARDSWFIRTTELRDELKANNDRVRWHPPEIGTGRFGEWLENNVDWALSRNRYWGTPLPAWVCERDPAHLEFIGSFAELVSGWEGSRSRSIRTARSSTSTTGSAASPAAPGPCAAPRGDRRLVRLGCDALRAVALPVREPGDRRALLPGGLHLRGSGPDARVVLLADGDLHPARRGPAYRNVVVNDLVLDAEGQKMSKSRGNVVDPWEAIGEHGADAIRWYLLASSHPWLPKRFDPAGVREVQRKVFDTLRSTYHFFSLYANLEGWSPSAEDPSWRSAR
jgi:isoleucyl-tRNA synthetase